MKPSITSVFFTQSFSVCAEQPIFDATEETAAPSRRVILLVIQDKPNSPLANLS